MKIMHINEFYKICLLVMEVNQSLIYTDYRRISMPRIVCEDGWKVSVQCGKGLYSIPRADRMPSYTAFELGYPSDHEPLLDGYAENSDNWCCIYLYVPIELIDQVIEKHGGIVDAILR